MTVTDALDDLRSNIAGCDLVAYADLSSSMVLTVSAATKHRQEELDQLSQIAVCVLDGAIAEGGLPIVGEEDTAVHVAMALDATSARLFLRSPGTPTEALICVCAPSSDLSSAIALGTAALESLAEAS